MHDADGNRLAEYEIDNVTGARTLLQEYIWHDGVPVAVVDGGTDAVFFVRTDHIGRPVFATSDTGVKVWEATYLPFGGVHSTTGSAIDLRFPGQWFQSESGLHQNWMREYDPTTGRYIQGDPLGLVDGASVYGYALQNPGRYIDPTGEQVPAWMPGGPYSPTPGPDGRYQSLRNAPGVKPYCEFVPKDAVKGSKHPGYWKYFSGKGKAQRYNLDGKKITSQEAHPGNPLRLPTPRIPMLLFDFNVMLQCGSCPQT